MGPSKLHEKFKKDWIDKSIQSLFIPDTEENRKKLSDIFDETFRPSQLSIFNSVHYEYTEMRPEDYYYRVPEKCILVENGVLYTKTSVKESIESSTLRNKVNRRQITKRKKIAETNPIRKADLASKEANDKRVANAQYGQSAYPGSPNFNIDNADSTTCGARNIDAIVAMLFETIGGGWNHYDVSAYVKLIHYTKNQVNEGVHKKYTLEKVDREEVLKHLLGRYYEDYYAKTFLRNVLQTMDDDTVSMLYIKNNYKQFYRVKEVADKVRELFKIIKETDSNMNNPKDEKFRDIMKYLQSASEDLLYGYVYFSGDYLNGKRLTTSVDMILAKKRKVVVNMDTDSVNTSVYYMNEFILDEFKDVTEELVKENKLERYSLSILNASILLGSVLKLLKTYTSKAGVDPSLVHLIDLELEKVMNIQQLTTSKKRYAYNYSIADFLVAKPHSISKVGMLDDKSNFNDTMCEVADSILSEITLKDHDSLKHSKLLNTIQKNTEIMLHNIRSKEHVLETRTSGKILSTSLTWRDYRLKSIMLWNFLYGETEQYIEVPGVFGMIKIDFTPEILNTLKTEEPDTYARLLEAHKTLRRWSSEVAAKEFTTAFLNNSETALETIKSLGGLGDNRRLFTHMCNEINKYPVPKVYTGDIFKIFLSYYKQGDDKFKKLTETLFKISILDTEAKIHRDIRDKFTRLALPDTMSSIPTMISRNGFELITLESVSEFQGLNTDMANSAGLATYETKLGREVITSMLKSF